MTALDWTVPALAAAAAPAGIVVAALAAVALRRRVSAASAPSSPDATVRAEPGRRGLAGSAAVWTAALARGAAAALALAAAAGPQTVETIPDHGAVVVAAPDDAVVEHAAEIVRWPSEVPDAGAALEAARAVPPRAVPAIVAFALGDGAAPRPALPTADSLRTRGAETVVLRPADVAQAPTRAARLHVAPPPAPSEGVAFALVVTADAAGPPFSGGTATLTIDGVASEFALPDGARRAATPEVALRAGTHVVSVAAPDRVTAALSLRVAPPPTVLVVTANGDEPPLARRLRTQGLRVSVVSDAQADLAAAADVIVLGPGAGVRCAADIASRAAAGAGLLVAGGEGALGLSRLRGTALEPLLPASLPARPEPPAPDEPPRPPEEPDDPPPEPGAEEPVLDEGERQALRVALLLVVDRSGSMAGTKLLMAREAAMAAARTLSPDDRIGVLAFDTDCDWVAPFQDARDMPALHRRLQSLTAQGGTDLHRALKEALAAIARERCGIRHVVVLTDGATPDRVWGDLVAPAVAQAVTLSTVAVGDGADTRLLGLLAGLGKGRLYPAVDPARLPQVITLDTRRFVHEPRDRRRDAAREPAPDVVPPAPPRPEPPRTASPAARERPPEPVAAPPRVPHVSFLAPFLAGVEREPWPPLVHPESAPPRGAASAPLLWDDGGAALVVGRAASGRCAVVAADVVTAGGRDLWAWPESGRVLAQLVRALAPPPDAAQASPAARFADLDGGAAQVVVAAPGGGTLRFRAAGGGPETTAVCGAQGRVSAALLARRPVPGVHTGDFVPRDAGDGAPVVAVCALPQPPSAGAVAAELSLRSGARLVDALPAPPPAPPREERHDRTAPLLGAAALLLLVEAAARRRAHGGHRT